MDTLSAPTNLKYPVKAHFKVNFFILKLVKNCLLPLLQVEKPVSPSHLILPDWFGEQFWLLEVAVDVVEVVVDVVEVVVVVGGVGNAQPLDIEHTSSLLQIFVICQLSLFEIY